MEEIYFDNSATTRVCDEAVKAAVMVMQDHFGNPSSVHHKGSETFHNLNNARDIFAKYLNVSGDEIYFTSGGTESNNTVLFGATQQKKAQRIIVSSIEHPSVMQPAKYLQNKGCDVCFLPVNEQGIVRLDILEDMINEQTSLVSIMHVNNETGTVQPLYEIGQLIRKKAPQAVFHIDGVQSFGRIPVSLRLWQADAYSASAHKIHACKGSGLLWVKKGTGILPLLQGGGQEKGFRSGTENIPGIMAFAVAAEIACSKMDDYAVLMNEVKTRLTQSLMDRLPDVFVNGQDLADAAPHIVNLSFLGVRSEVLLHYLEEHGIYVSAGSACNSRSSKGSPILQEMGLSNDRVDSALRFSFSRYNTVRQVDLAVDSIVSSVEEIRSIMSRKKRRR